MERIVVGVDESRSAEAAARWAVRECELRGGRLTAVLAWTFLGQLHGDGGDAFQTDHGEAQAAKVLEQILAPIDAGGVEIDRQVTCGLPAETLLDASAGADLLVVGARGMGGFRGLLLGSVSQQVAHHTTVPLAIVRESAEVPPGAEHIVVGVDGSPASRRALDWALDEARARGAAVTVVHAFWPVVGPDIWPVAPLADLEAAAVHALHEFLEAADTDDLASPVDERAVEGGPADAILAAAETATLIVVGSRGRGGFRGLLLGSVSQHVVHHATCPVVVIPAPSD